MDRFTLLCVGDQFFHTYLTFHLFDVSFLSKIDLSSFYYYMVTVFLLILILFSLSLVLSNSFFSQNKIIKFSTYECGFSPIYLDIRNRFFMPYFRVSLLFLIFDLEILYFIPLLLILKYFLLSGLCILFFKSLPLFFLIYVGIIYEYIYGSVDWLS